MYVVITANKQIEYIIQVPNQQSSSSNSFQYTETNSRAGTSAENAMVASTHAKHDHHVEYDEPR